MTVFARWNMIRSVDVMTKPTEMPARLSATASKNMKKENANSRCSKTPNTALLLSWSFLASECPISNFYGDTKKQLKLR